MSLDTFAFVVNENKNYHLLFIPIVSRRLMGPSKQLKQIIQIEHNIVKNPNWLEANQLAIYKSGRGIELRATLITALITSDIHSGRYPIHGMRVR